LRPIYSGSVGVTANLTGISPRPKSCHWIFRVPPVSNDQMLIEQFLVFSVLFFFISLSFMQEDRLLINDDEGKHCGFRIQNFTPNRFQGIFKIKQKNIYLNIF